MEGNELREWRKRLQMTQAALAEALGVTPNTVARWERGALKIGNPALIRPALAMLEAQKKLHPTP